MEEEAIFIVGNQLRPRNIVPHRKNDLLKKACRDSAMQRYHAMSNNFSFCTDGYHFNVKMMDPVSGEETTMKCSGMNQYSY